MSAHAPIPCCRLWASRCPRSCHAHRASGSLAHHTCHNPANRHAETAHTNADLYLDPHPCAYCHAETTYTDADPYPDPHFYPYAHCHSYSCAHCYTDTASTDTDLYPDPHSYAYCHPYTGPPASKGRGGHDRYPCRRVHHGQRC